MSMEAWLSKHSYLRPIAEFHAEISTAMARISVAYAHTPNWPQYVDDYKQGIPVLKSSQEVIDCGELRRIVISLLRLLSCAPLSGQLKQKSMELHSEFHGNPRQLAAWLLSNGDCTSSHPGLLRYIGWSALTQYLQPLVGAFEDWRDEESWMRSYCPICGSGPSMAQLASTDSGRRRSLVCGCCGTRWQFHRIGCPFCKNTNDQELSTLSIEGEKDLRIDCCHSCSGYLKTYNGEGQESLMLADWTSLHLDFLAQDRGMKRLATSLYEL